MTYIISNYSHKTKAAALKRVKQWHEAKQLSDDCKVFEVKILKTYQPVEKIVLQEAK